MKKPFTFKKLFGKITKYNESGSFILEEKDGNRILIHCDCKKHNDDARHCAQPDNDHNHVDVDGVVCDMENGRITQARATNVAVLRIIYTVDTVKHPYPKSTARKFRDCGFIDTLISDEDGAYLSLQNRDDEIYYPMDDKEAKEVITNAFAGGYHAIITGKSFAKPDGNRIIILEKIEF